MQHLQATYGVNHIFFVDDLFLASRQRTVKLCELILENQLQMTWSCAARIDTVKPDLLALMKKAGCWEISFGLETGSQELLLKMDKQASVERAEQAVHWTYDAGIRIKGLFMLGYPGESAQTISETKAYVKRLPMHFMNLTKFTPYPGSPIYRDLYGTNIRDEHFERMNGMNFVWAPEGLTIEELDRQYQKIIMAFYQRHRVMVHILKLSLQNPENIRRLCGFLFGALWAKLRSRLRGRRGLLIGTHEKHLDSL